MKALLKAFKGVVSDANTYTYVEGLRQRGFTREYARKLEDAYRSAEKRKG